MDTSTKASQNSNIEAETHQNAYSNHIREITMKGNALLYVVAQDTSFLGSWGWGRVRKV